MKERNKKKTDQDMLREIINVMFVIAGHDVGYDDIKDRKDAWYMQWTMTLAQQDRFIEWLTGYIRKNKHYPKSTAVRQAHMINLMWGLRTVPNDGATDTE
jgi:hypothetical protein